MKLACARYAGSISTGQARSTCVMTCWRIPAIPKTSGSNTAGGVSLRLALLPSGQWSLRRMSRSTWASSTNLKASSPRTCGRVLPQLKQAGYILGVISNRDKPFQDLLHEHGIGEFFEFSLAAGEVNTFKPEPGVFEHALREMNLSPQDVIYVGDNYYADVVGARPRGTLACSLRPAESSPTRIARRSSPSMS